MRKILATAIMMIMLTAMSFAEYNVILTPIREYQNGYLVLAEAYYDQDRIGEVKEAALFFDEEDHAILYFGSAVPKAILILIAERGDKGLIDTKAEKIPNASYVDFDDFDEEVYSYRVSGDLVDMYVCNK